jgi:hypothetical protein
MFIPYTAAQANYQTHFYFTATLFGRFGFGNAPTPSLTRFISFMIIFDISINILLASTYRSRSPFTMPRHTPIGSTIPDSTVTQPAQHYHILPSDIDG